MITHIKISFRIKQMNFAKIFIFKLSIDRVNNKIVLCERKM